ncbi:MAG TPA: FKBP-type peptidyl-prolyl cis-trans isomerase [Mycobacteriales bacterium]
MRRLLVSIASVALTVVACGTGTDTTTASAVSSAPTVTPTPTVTSPSPQGSLAGPAIPPGKCDLSVSSDIAHKPTVTFPKTCDVPRTLVSKDIVAGTGPALKAGQTAVVQYVGISLSNQQEFDASWDRGQPFPVEDVGHAGVIDGWNQGLPGMHQGGRRLLVIPPELGYGSSGTGPIGPNETLIFVVDLVSISG